MSRKLLLISGLVFLLTSITLTIRVQMVEASGTVYIRANGLIEGTDKITSADNITYTFTGNINDSIIIERSNIIVDGEGYTLEGTGVNVGIWTSGINNITIRELEIRGFAGGIYLDFGSSNNKILDNLITTNNGVGIQINQESNSNTVSGNNITASTDDGIFISLSSYNTISGNNITGGSYDGVYLQDSSFNIVSLNSISANDGDGVGFYVSHNNTILENSIAGNEGDGVGIYLSQNNTVSENSIAQNNGDGVAIYDSTHNLVSENDVVENTYDGTHLTDSNYNTISGNDIALNGGDGVGFYFSHNNTISGNLIAGNNDGDGIGLYSSYNNIVSGNNITWNTYDGIYFSSSSSNIISGNFIKDNDVGLELDSSSDNKFFHNDLIDNFEQVIVDNSNNLWDDGYPSGGNYWNDFSDIDNNSGPYQNQTGSDGIWDHPYVIDENNIDHYPIVPEFLPTIAPLFLMATSLLAIALKKRKPRL